MCDKPCTCELVALLPVACFLGQQQMLAVQYILAVPAVVPGLEVLRLHLSEAELRSMIKVQDFAVAEPDLLRGRLLAHDFGTIQ